MADLVFVLPAHDRGARIEAPSDCVESCICGSGKYLEVLDDALGGRKQLGGEGACALGQVSVCRIEDESIARGCEDAKPQRVRCLKAKASG